MAVTFDRRMPRLTAIFALSLAVAGCHLTSVEAVQAVAGTDFSCPDDKVKVTPAQEKDTFEAAGCGKNGTFVCEGWDSYNQKPICRQK